jgi:hypothetical protein
MYLVIVVAVYILFAICFVDWKRWREYYPTIQFYIVFNLLYNFLFFRHTLWAFQAKTFHWLNHTLIDITFSFFIIPVIIMIYLRYQPSGGKLIIYTSIWIVYFSFLEYIFWKRGLFIYQNGWGPMWSSIFNIIMFTLLRIHYKHPLTAILMCIPIITILLFLFHPALSQLK